MRGRYAVGGRTWAMREEYDGGALEFEPRVPAKSVLILPNDVGVIFDSV